MRLNERARRAHIEKAQPLLPPGARVIDYAPGNSASWPTKLIGRSVLGAWLASTVVLSLLLHRFVFVGGLPLIAVFYGVNQGRGVALADRGVATLRTSFFNGQPRDVIAISELGTLDRVVEQKAGASRVQIGNEAVWLTDPDLARFRSARLA